MTRNNALIMPAMRIVLVVHTVSPEKEPESEQVMAPPRNAACAKVKPRCCSCKSNCRANCSFVEWLQPFEFPWQEVRGSRKILHSVRDGEHYSEQFKNLLRFIRKQT